MQREKMAGVNLRERIMEVAFEQWTEQEVRRTSVGFNVIPTLQGSNIGRNSRIDREQRGFSEFRWYRG